MWHTLCGSVRKVPRELSTSRGYVVFSGKKRLQWLKRNCDQTAHWESRRGSHLQAKEYCSKEESRVDGPWEAGEEGDHLGGQGKRNDMLALKRKR